MNPLLSVIIPVYKVEEYLERCVMSVINQNYVPMEIILVDDGSPDRCPQICDELATRDSRLRVIHKTNGGLSSARNAGISIAQGDYLAFLDSDDQWIPGKLSLLMEKVLASDVAVTIYSSLVLYENGRLIKREDTVIKNEFEEISKMELYSRMISAGDLHTTAYTKIIKSEFLREHNLTFRDGIISEDVEWMLRLLRKVDKMALSSIPLVIYSSNRPGSITNTASSKSVRDTLSIIQNSIDFYNENPQERTRWCELAQCSFLWSVALGFFDKVPSEDADSLRRQMKEIKELLDLTAHPKSKRVGMLYSMLGFSLTSKVCALYIKLLRRRMNNISING